MRQGRRRLSNLNKKRKEETLTRQACIQSISRRSYLKMRAARSYAKIITNLSRLLPACINNQVIQIVPLQAMCKHKDRRSLKMMRI